MISKTTSFLIPRPDRKPAAVVFDRNGPCQHSRKQKIASNLLSTSKYQLPPYHKSYREQSFISHYEVCDFTIKPSQSTLIQEMYTTLITVYHLPTTEATGYDTRVRNSTPPPLQKRYAVDAHTTCNSNI